MIALVGIAAIALGIVLVLADERVGRFGPRGPEVGAVQVRVLGMILLIAGGLAFLTWTR